jgi:hypothetical protein
MYPNSFPVSSVPFSKCNLTLDREILILYKDRITIEKGFLTKQKLRYNLIAKPINEFKQRFPQLFNVLTKPGGID